MALDKTSDVTSLSEPPNDLVMVIEDSDEDYEILLRTVKKIPLKCKLMRYDTGDEALEYLFGDDDNAEPDLVELPKLILLDLNLPGTDGKTVLAKIKSAPRLKVIPVVIFSTSSNPKDLKECYLKGSNGYVIKPMDIQKLQNCIRLLLEYWLLNNRLPALDLILSEPDPA